jgi:hypothetical protein
MAIKYITTTKEWLDKVNGNSYFSVQIESTEDKNFLIKIPFQYGYGDQSFYTAREILKEKKLIPTDYTFPSELPIKHIKIDKCLKKEVEAFGTGKAEDFNPNMNGISSYYQRGN